MKTLFTKKLTLTRLCPQIATTSGSGIIAITMTMTATTTSGTGITYITTLMTTTFLTIILAVMMTSHDGMTNQVFVTISLVSWGLNLGKNLRDFCVRFCV